MTQNETQEKNPEGVGNTIMCQAPPSSRARNWFFTLNNYTKNDITQIELLEIECKIQKYVFQEEKGENGTEHLQGTLVFKNARSFDSMKKLLPRANWSKVKNLKASMAYCCKEDTRNGKTYTYNYEIPITEEEMWKKFIEMNRPTMEEVKAMNLQDM